MIAMIIVVVPLCIHFERLCPTNNANAGIENDYMVGEAIRGGVFGYIFGTLYMFFVQ